jgi:hypothetical protein
MCAGNKFFARLRKASVRNTETETTERAEVVKAEIRNEQASESERERDRTYTSDKLHRAAAQAICVIKPRHTGPVFHIPDLYTTH